MAWRPYENLIEGERDNRTPGKVTGWLSFVGLPDRSPGYMTGFCLVQTGAAGEITAGRPPQDYVRYPYVEWYGNNGRVVLELDPSQVEVVGEPLPWESEQPVSLGEQRRNLLEFMASVAGVVAEPSEGEG
jgi:hypothetical protein